jgi:hypothetical protein
VFGPKAERKRIPWYLRSQFASLQGQFSNIYQYPDVNVLAFVSNLGAKQQAKNAQSWPQDFLALTPSVKQA